tara:strand:+ start:759 stop:869 length:111 start_codon:yes stop_codon:yes gene_type:complete
MFDYDELLEEVGVLEQAEELQLEACEYEELLDEVVL